MTADTVAGLRLRGITVRFPDAERPALDGVDLELVPGRVLAVLGPSGCGKSTLLRVIAGLQPASGSVLWGDEDLTRVPTYKRGFALMFQDGQLFGHMNVADNVGYALKRQHLDASARAERVARLLKLVGLEDFERRSPGTLSGGQQQRVALARALAARPRLLLLDEPLSALDRSLRERLGADLREILRAEGITAMLVTHDQDEALLVADDMAIMREGRIVVEGDAVEVWRNPPDEETAEFLGFSTLLSAEQSAALGLDAQPHRTRRTGVRVLGITQASLGKMTNADEAPGVYEPAGANRDLASASAAGAKVVSVAPAGDFMAVECELMDAPGQLTAMADTAAAWVADLKVGASVKVAVLPDAVIALNEKVRG